MRWLSGLFIVGVTLAQQSPSPNPTGQALKDYCDAQWSHFAATYKSTEIATSRWTWYEGFGPTDSIGHLTGSVTSQSYWTSTYLYTQYANRAYTPTPPCCGSCYMTAGTIEFFFWPDQATPTAPAPGQPSTSVDSKGFTFTSPSVYMAFSSLEANNKCGAVGTAWSDTTIALDADEITTARPITTLTVLSTPTVEAGKTYNYIISAITTKPPPRRMTYTDLGQNCSTISGYVYWPDNPINAANANVINDPCHPVIEIPSRLLSLQPAWASAECGMPPGTSGAYDPPRVLTPMLTGTALAAPTPKWQTRAETTSTASPQEAVPAIARSTLPVTTGVTAVFETISSATVAESGSASEDVPMQEGGVGGAIASGVDGSPDVSEPDMASSNDGGSASSTRGSDTSSADATGTAVAEDSSSVNEASSSSSTLSSLSTSSAFDSISASATTNAGPKTGSVPSDIFLTFPFTMLLGLLLVRL